MKYILYSEELGIYLGSFIGLGFWSKLDPAGQDCAIAFSSHEEALSFAESWDSKPTDLEVKPVDVLGDPDGYASIASCVKAGLPGWMDESMQCRNSLPA